MRDLIESEHAAARVEAAAAWLAARRREPVVIVAARRGAADAIVRRIAHAQGAVIGWERLTLDALAGRIAAPELARRGLTPVSGPALEAFCARLLHRKIAAGARHELGRFAPIADRPGMPRALASTLAELAHADLTPGQVRSAAPDLAELYAAYLNELPAQGLADRATVLKRAVAVLCEEAKSEGGGSPLARRPLLLLDVPIRWPLEADLVAALAARAPAVRITVPRGDERTRALLCERLQIALAQPPAVDLAPAIAALQTRLFRDADRRVEADDAVEIVSAPGESRECLEIARRILGEAARGTRFDRIGVLLRAPEIYRVHLAEAFRRAGIPAFFTRGARRPDPAGRALLALLACAAEGLSARAFSEYLSLGVVPDAVGGAPPDAKPARSRFVPADEELAGGDEHEDGEGDPLEPPPDDAYEEDAPVRAGTLRAPRRWEQLIADAAVIGGRERWTRRLAHEIAATRAAMAELDDPEGAEARAAERRLADLEMLREFALPLIEALAALPARAPWGEWIDALSAIATRALRDPRRVLAVLSELAPMAEVGPVDLAEVRAVLTPRLRDDAPRLPREDRAGKVLVCAIDEVRGRELDVVFVPGLAEKVFPAKVLEDPLLLDAARKEIAARAGAGRTLSTRRDRMAEERLLLAIAVGAARRRLVASIPRIDGERGRPRVPSFYALEIARAIEGAPPSFEALGRRAEIAGAARFGWPAPSDPALAIDEAERDLAVLGHLFSRPPAERAGKAAYLVAASPIAARALRARWRRHDVRWRPQDGLVDPDEAVRAILARHTLRRRPYSPTALESFASCPYRFFLRAIVRLEPREVPEPLQHLQPRERGTILHAIQFRLLSRLRAEGALPVRPAQLESALAALEETVRVVGAEFEETLLPVIPHVWQDTLASIHRDLREWLQRMAEDSSWTPIRFELAFGLPAGQDRDPASRPDPVPLPILGARLRGSIDLVEERAGVLRATDHKSGSVYLPAKGPAPRVFRGQKLQPILYALALEALFPGQPVWGGRLYYCTAKGSYAEIGVPLDDAAREAIEKVLAAIDDAVRSGFLPAAPAPKACNECEYRPICGHAEEARTARKDKKRLDKLLAIREMP